MSMGHAIATKNLSFCHALDADVLSCIGVQLHACMPWGALGVLLVHGVNAAFTVCMLRLSTHVTLIVLAKEKCYLFVVVFLQNPQLWL